MKMQKFSGIFSTKNSFGAKVFFQFLLLSITLNYKTKKHKNLVKPISLVFSSFSHTRSYCNHHWVASGSYFVFQILSLRIKTNISIKIFDRPPQWKWTQVYWLQSGHSHHCVYLKTQNSGSKSTTNLPQLNVTQVKSSAQIYTSVRCMTSLKLEWCKKVDSADTAQHSYCIIESSMLGWFCVVVTKEKIYNTSL